MKAQQQAASRHMNTLTSAAREVAARGLQSVKQLFENQRKARDEVQKGIDALREEVSALQQQRAAILAAPASREELKAKLRAGVETRAAAFPQELASRLVPIAREPERFMSSQQKVDADLGLLSHPSRYGEAAPCGLVDALIFGLMKDQVLAALMGAVDRLDLPADGLTLAARAEAVKKLDASIAEINGELERVFREAQAAGMELS
jgi:hypothetical protein